MKEELKRHAYSFAKTYITALIAIALFASSKGVDIFTVAFIVPALKASLITVLRNVYKGMTEGTKE